MSKTAAVTGANGFLGSHIVTRLLRDGYHVKSLVRDKLKAQQLSELKNTEIIEYQLDSIPSIKKATKNTQLLIHAAALHTRSLAQKKQILETNVTGTENVIRAIDNIDQFVFVSSIRSLMTTKESLITENTPYDFANFDTPYGSSKYLAEQTCLKYFRTHHLPLYLINPAVIIGPNDQQPSYNGKLIRKHLHQRIVFVTPAMWSIVDVRDVADSIPFVIANSKMGEKHIVCSTHLTLKKFFSYIDQSAHQKKIYITVPYLPLKLAGATFELLEKIAPSFDPPIVSSGADIARLQIHFSGNKLKKMGFHYRQPRQTIQDTVNWFLHH